MHRILIGLFILISSALHASPLHCETELSDILEAAGYPRLEQKGAYKFVAGKAQYSYDAFKENQKDLGSTDFTICLVENCGKVGEGTVPSRSENQIQENEYKEEKQKLSNLEEALEHLKKAKDSETDSAVAALKTKYEKSKVAVSKLKVAATERAEAYSAWTDKNAVELYNIAGNTHFIIHKSKSGKKAFVGSRVAPEACQYLPTVMANNDLTKTGPKSAIIDAGNAELYADLKKGLKATYSKNKPKNPSADPASNANSSR